MPGAISVKGLARGSSGDTIALSHMGFEPVDTSRHKTPNPTDSQATHIISHGS